MKKIKKAIKQDYNSILGLIIFLMFSIITLGYAVFYKDIGLNGNINLQKLGKVRITKVELDTSKSNNTLPENALVLTKEGNLEINYNTTVSREEKTYQSTYLIYITNESPFDYTYTGISLNPDVIITNGKEEDGGASIEYNFDKTNKKNTLEEGDLVKKEETKVLAVTLIITVGSEKQNINITIGGSLNANSSLDNTGEIKGTVIEKELDLSEQKELACFDVEVINTYKYRRSFSLKSANENFILVNENKEPLTDFYIDEPNEFDGTSNKKIYNICIKKNENSVFTEEKEKTIISLETNNIPAFSIGELIIKVDLSEEIDNKKPEISNVTLKINKYDQETNSLLLNTSWQRQDSGGTEITNYYIELYEYDKETSKKIKTYNQQSALTNYQIILDKTFLETYRENMITNNYDYYIKVYGKDKAGNTGGEDCASNNEYCPSSEMIKLKWEFNVDATKLVNMSLSSESSTKVYINNQYQATFTVNNYYSLPSSITVIMNGIELEVNKDYTYSATGTGSLNITTNITGDISISGTARYSGGVCLAKGTKIKLANGNYKNIEDIKYDDLILAFSHELGKIIYTYPIWIEKEGRISEYQKTTYSDGTTIETIGTHGIFSIDKNKYVSVQDRKNFNIGTKVIKIDKNNNLKTVTVKKIETIEKNIKYYHVSSTRYHNVIANDLLTTDAMLIISNMFPFNKDMLWSKERDNFLKEKDLFYYKDWTHLFPPHIFKGFRMEEAKYLYNKNKLNIKIFSEVLNNLMLKPPVNKNNKNIWPVITSDELSKGLKSTSYEEGTYYTLPNPKNNKNKNFKGWYNTSNNKYYKINEKVKIDYGMYFEAVWE